MTVCPYCRGAIDTSSDDHLSCEGCGTEHHPDCYQENGGCTVFGCRCAPAEEQKVSIAAPDLVHTAVAESVRQYYPPAPPPPPMPGVPALDPPTGPSVEELASNVVPSIFGSYYNGSYSGTSYSSETQTSETETHHEPKSRTGFILLGALLGALGAHSFYAGYKKKGLAQLAITVVSLGFAAPMTWIWAIIDICTIDRDNHGVNFTS